MNEERGETGNNTIHWAKVRCSFPAPVQDDELVLEQQRFGDDGANATWTDQLGDGRDEMNEQDRKIAHDDGIVTSGLCITRL